MAEKTTAKIVITAEGDKAVSAAKKVQKELKATGSAGKKAGADVDAGADKGASGLKKMDSAAGKSEGALTSLSVSVLGLGASITGLSDAILGFNEKTVALERSTFGLKEMTIQVAREQEDLAKAIQEGTLSAEEEKRAIEDLGLSMEALAIEERTVKAEAEALSGEWVSFAVNTGTTVVQSIVAITSMLALKTSGTAAATGATVAHTGAMWGAVAAVRGFTTAMLASPLAPYAIAAIAAGTAFMALETNLLGVRDGIEDLTGMERGSFPTLGKHLGLVEEKTDNAAEAAIDYAKQAEEIARQAREGFIPALDDSANSVSNLGGELRLVSSEAESVTKRINGLGDSLDRLKKKRPLSIIEDSAVDATLIALGALADAERKIREVSAFKGVIDASMMEALVQAEKDGLINAGTAGLYRAKGVAVYHSSLGGTLNRAVNILNGQSFAGFFGLDNDPNSATFGQQIMKFANGLFQGAGQAGAGSIGQALLDIVASSGVGRGKAVDGNGNRIRTRNGGRGLSLSARAKEARRVAANNIKSNAEALNSFFGVGAFGVGTFTANRFRNYLAQDKTSKLEFRALGVSTGTQDILARTGIDPSSFYGQSFQFPIFGRASRTRIIHNGRRVTYYYLKQMGFETITTGSSGRARLAAVSLANAEAQREVQAFNALVAFNPNFSGMNLAASGINTSYLTQKLSEEQTRIGNMIDRYGFNKTEIVTMESTQQGNVVLNGMMDFRERMGLISGGIV